MLQLYPEIISIPNLHLLRRVGIDRISETSWRSSKETYIFCQTYIFWWNTKSSGLTFISYLFVVVSPISLTYYLVIAFSFSPSQLLILRFSSVCTVACISFQSTTDNLGLGTVSDLNNVQKVLIGCYRYPLKSFLSILEKIFQFMLAVVLLPRII
jgi:hypothetical protein